MLGKYYKALITFLGVLATGVVSLVALINTIGSEPSITAALPADWSAKVIGFGALVTGVGTVLTTVITFLVRNQKTVDQVDAAITAGDFTLEDLKSLINKRDVSS